MTNIKKKICRNLNWILCAIIFIILIIVFCYRYFKIGIPAETNLTEEIFKYICMWPILTSVCWSITWIIYNILISYIDKKHNNTKK